MFAKSETGNKRSFRIILFLIAMLIVAFSVIQYTGMPGGVNVAIQKVKLWTGLFNADKAAAEQNEGGFLVSEDHFNLLLKNPEGEELSLSEFHGKVIFINIWASWCPPCIAEMPTIEDLYTSFKDNEQVEFILLSVDDDPGMAIGFMKKNNYELPFYFSGSELPETLQYSFIPTTFVISPEGNVIYKNAGMADYSTKKFKEWLLSKVPVPEVENPEVEDNAGF